MSQNHLTEVLDSFGDRLYSQSTLHVAGLQAHGCKGRARETATKARRRGWAAEPRPPGRRLSSKAGTTLIKPPEPQPGAFFWSSSPSSAQRMTERAAEAAILEAIAVRGWNAV